MDLLNFEGLQSPETFHPLPLCLLIMMLNRDNDNDNNNMGNKRINNYSGEWFKKWSLSKEMLPIINLLKNETDHFHILFDT